MCTVYIPMSSHIKAVRHIEIGPIDQHCKAERRSSRVRCFTAVLRPSIITMEGGTSCFRVVVPGAKTEVIIYVTVRRTQLEFRGGANPEKSRTVDEEFVISATRDSASKMHLEKGVEMLSHYERGFSFHCQVRQAE
jgi:hypothetical protein